MDDGIKEALSICRCLPSVMAPSHISTEIFKKNVSEAYIKSKIYVKLMNGWQYGGVRVNI